MAQVWTTKQQNFLSRLSTAAVDLIKANDALVSLSAEYTANLYGNGQANAMTDAVVQAVLPASTASLLFSAATTIASVTSTVNTNRASLESLRQ
jgi:hypothetical protein